MVEEAAILGAGIRVADIPRRDAPAVTRESDTQAGIQAGTMALAIFSAGCTWVRAPAR
ncbi:MAG: hypothetical protein JO159_13575 [Acidobacteria bacterium]|nr:hypothetical protein [Acidobacteriota bacterium]